MSMSSRRILCDATELLGNPVRTGIQRVVRSMLKHWPDSDELILCRYDSQNGLTVVPRKVTALLIDPDDGTTAVRPDELAREIAGLVGRAVPVPADLPILVPEVFFDFARCAVYRRLLGANPERTSFIAYDFIPYLHPESIGVRETAHLMHYVQLLRDARRVGFISSHTREDYARRITRRGDAVDGPVFPMGADGPRIPRQEWSPQRTAFLIVGSIDGRKNQAVVLDAFEKLWSAGVPARLTLVGRTFDNGHVEELRARISRLASAQPLFDHYADIGDDELAGLYAQCRATIYASELEGFGLPPVESLHCGVPVIASAALPSLVDIPEHGQVRLGQITAESVAGAVRRLMDDAEAQALWQDAAHAQTATWADMAAAVAAWVRA